MEFLEQNWKGTKEKEKEKGERYHWTRDAHVPDTFRRAPGKISADTIQGTPFRPKDQLIIDVSSFTGKAFGKIVLQDGVNHNHANSRSAASSSRRRESFTGIDYCSWVPDLDICADKPKTG